MLSRALASQALRRPLLASTSALTPARQLRKYLPRNLSTTGQPVSDGNGKQNSVRRHPTSSDAWSPPVVAYDQVKLMTEQPSPVCPPLLWPRDTHTPHQDSYLIDVREPDEVIQGSIPSSVNIPLTALPGSLHMSPEDFEKQFGFKKPKRQQEIIFYCRSGVRAATAGDIAKKNGYEKYVCQDLRPDDILTSTHVRLYNYKGSWLEWVQKEGRKVGTP